MRWLKIVSLILMLAVVAGVYIGIKTLFDDITDDVGDLFSDETDSTTTSSEDSSGEVTSSTAASTVDPSGLEWTDPDREYYIDQSDMALGYCKSLESNEYLYCLSKSFEPSEGYSYYTIEWIIDPAFVYEVDAYFNVRTYDTGEKVFAVYVDNLYLDGKEDIEYIPFSFEQDILHGASLFQAFPHEDYGGARFLFAPLSFEANSVEEAQAICKMLDKYVHVRIYYEEGMS